MSEVCLTFLFLFFLVFFFFKHKTAYEMRISDWSSDVCSSDLHSTRVRFPCNERENTSLQGFIRCSKDSVALRFPWCRAGDIRCIERTPSSRPSGSYPTSATGRHLCPTWIQLPSSQQPH